MKKIEDKFDKTVALLSVKHTNVFLWRIDGCKEILKQAKDVGQESDPFYTKTETDGYGYKLKVKKFTLVDVEMARIPTCRCSLL